MNFNLPHSLLLSVRCHSLGTGKLCHGKSTDKFGVGQTKFKLLWLTESHFPLLNIYILDLED